MAFTRPNSLAHPLPSVFATQGLLCRPDLMFLYGLSAQRVAEQCCTCLQGNLLRARDIWLKGIRQTTKRPNPFLYQSVAVLAGEMGLTAESRQWFKDATKLFRGAGRHGVWQAWAQMEARQGERDNVRCDCSLSSLLL